jgi:hypothetical protein
LNKLLNKDLIEFEFFSADYKTNVYSLISSRNKMDALTYLNLLTGLSYFEVVNNKIIPKNFINFLFYIKFLIK